MCVDKRRGLLKKSGREIFLKLLDTIRNFCKKKVGEFIKSQYNATVNPQINLIDKRIRK